MGIVKSSCSLRFDLTASVPGLTNTDSSSSISFSYWIMCYGLVSLNCRECMFDVRRRLQLRKSWCWAPFAKIVVDVQMVDKSENYRVR